MKLSKTSAVLVQFLVITWVSSAGLAQEQPKGWLKLFNGKNLDGWTAYSRDPKARMEDVWSVKDGVLVCKGRPIGYLQTKRTYTNYVLRLQWRWPKKPGNSGVLLRVVGPDKVWPKSIEAQLASGAAGDFWSIGNFKMDTDPARRRGANTRKIKANENPVGQWNQYEIVVDHGNIILKVNGEVVNKAENCTEIAGKIGLQSEGTEIHFRNIELKPL